MCASSLLEIGKSGIFAYEQALSVAGHNIENAYTPGYNRQVTVFNEQQPGVSVSGIKRIYDNFIVKQLRNQISEYNIKSTYLEKINELDRFLGNEYSNIEKGLQGFFSALSNCSTSPSSTSLREVLLNKSNDMIANFKDASDKLLEQNELINNSLFIMVDKVNSIAQNIANINQKIKLANDNNSLLNERDVLLSELAEYMSFDTLEHADCGIDIYIANGNALILDSQINKLIAAPSSNHLEQFNIYMKSSNGTQDISSNIKGGKVAGLLDYRSEILNTSMQKLQRQAVILCGEINQQHSQGINSHGKLAGNLFSEINDVSLINNRVIANNQNLGSGDFKVNITDTALLTGSQYTMHFTSNNEFTIIRNVDNKLIVAGNTNQSDYDLDGFHLNISNAAFDTNDNFTIDPTVNFINKMQLMVADTEDLGFGLPIRGIINDTNQGNLNVTSITITDINNISFSEFGQLSPPIKIEFTSDTVYQLRNMSDNSIIASDLNYTPGQPNNVFPAGRYDPGYQINITGSARAGDVIDIEYNNDAAGDNRNALSLFTLQSKKSVENNLSLGDDYQKLANHISTKTNYYSTAESQSEYLLQESQSNRDMLSGVNVDEELMNLLQFQQFYKASAELISVANTIFDTIFDVIL